jgi:hypothetical protein
MIITDLDYKPDYTARAAGYGYRASIVTPVSNVTVWTNDNKSKFWITLWRPLDDSGCWSHLDAASAQCILNKLLTPKVTEEQRKLMHAQ